MSHGLTTRQGEALDFIEAHTAKHGYAPSYNEIMVNLGLHSKSGISRIINGLCNRGALTRLPDRPRTLKSTRVQL